MKKLVLAIGMLLFCLGSSYAQRTVSGVITDNSGEALIGANVIVEGTDMGTITDVDGSYSLTVPDGSDRLVISYTGYTTQTIDLSAGGSTDFVLLEGNLLDEIVVTGQGSGISKKRLSTTVDDLDAEEIDRLPAQQIDQLLQSTTPSAQVRLSSGQPGTAAMIRTRGPISAASSATPVIIIDGIRVDNLNSNPEIAVGTGGANISALADIPVESIEKIEYIKGGAATTLYGADAANGVIQIITKKGYNGQRTMPFVEFRAGSITGETKWLRFQRTGEAVFEPGLLTELKAGVSGGSEAFSYNFVGSLYQDDGFNDLNEQFKRSFNFGFSSNLSDKLKYNGSFSYTGFKYNLDYNANTSFSRFSAAEGGAYGDLDSLSNEDWEMRKELMQQQGAFTNITQRVNRLTAANNLTYLISNDLEASLVFGIENRNSRQADVTSNAFQIHVGSLAPGTTDQAELFRALRNVFTTTASFNLKHNKAIKDLSFITNVGARFFRTNDYQEALDASGGADGTSSVNNFSTKTAEDFALENANYGVYLSENIGWNDQLFLEFGGTLDKNTSAGADVGFQFLPKIGITYNVFEKPLNSTLANLRFRANYGEATNFAQPFSQDRTFVLESFLGAPAFRFANPGNTNLRSERVKTIEAGIDLGLFDYRLNFGATYYVARTVDALFTPDNIPSSGQLAQITNIGEIENKGWEFEMTANIINSGKYNLDLTASYNINENKVSDSGGAPPFNVGGFLVVGTWIEEGQSLGYLRGTDATLLDDGTYELTPNAFLGKSYAPTFGSFNLNYSFDKFSLFATSDYQFGGTNVDLSLLLRYLRGVEDGGVPEELQAGSFFNVVSFFTEKSDFFKIRNLGAAYDFGNIVDQISNVRIGLTMTNPFNWTAASFDPETTGSGIGVQNGFASGGFAYGTESQPRQIIGSIKISF